MSSITDMLTPQPPIAGNAGGFVLGTVASAASPDFQGMVQVNFTGWTDGKNLSQWMPVLYHYAGAEHGQYWLPEVDDIVLVGFMGPMLEKPFVMGSFYPVGASIPKEQYIDKNTNRYLKTAGGVTFAITDEDGKQGIDIQTPKGKRVWIDDSGDAITIEDGKNTVKLDGGGAIEITAEKTITIKTGSCSIEMDGNAGKLSISCGQLEIKASQTAEISSDNMMTLKGNMTKVEGQQLSLNGSAMSELKGGILKLN